MYVNKQNAVKYITRITEIKPDLDYSSIDPDVRTESNLRIIESAIQNETQLNVNNRRKSIPLRRSMTISAANDREALLLGLEVSFLIDKCKESVSLGSGIHMDLIHIDIANVNVQYNSDDYYTIIVEFFVKVPKEVWFKYYFVEGIENGVEYVDGVYVISDEQLAERETWQKNTTL